MESHLLQMRGLKPRYKHKTKGRNVSHLLQMRGLKPTIYLLQRTYCLVASFTDAWIETGY